MFHNFIPVAANLRKRGCETNMKCCFCDFPEETVNHVLLDCCWAHAFWNTLGLAQFVYKEIFQNMGDWLWFYFGTCSTPNLPFICYGTRMIWYCRNIIAHGK